jgi:hypothetical protein
MVHDIGTQQETLLPYGHELPSGFPVYRIFMPKCVVPVPLPKCALCQRGPTVHVSLLSMFLRATTQPDIYMCRHGCCCISPLIPIHMGLGVGTWRHRTWLGPLSVILGAVTRFLRTWTWTQQVWAWWRTWHLLPPPCDSGWLMQSTPSWLKD